MIKILLSSRLGDKKWTQRDLARRTGIRPNTISELYHEMADCVSLEQLDMICKTLECPLDKLMIWVPDEESTLKKNTSKDSFHKSLEESIEHTPNQ